MLCYCAMLKIFMPGSSMFKQNDAPPYFSIDVWKYLDTNFCSVGRKGESNSVAGKVTALDYCKLLCLSLCEKLCLFFSDPFTILYERKDWKSNCSCDYFNFINLRKIMSFRTNHVTRVEGRPFEPNNLWITYLRQRLKVHIKAPKWWRVLFYKCYWNCSKTFWPPCKS